MSFESGLQAGLAASTHGSNLKTQANNRKLANNRDSRDVARDARNKKQRELTNLQTYGVNSDGSYTARGNQLLQNKSEQALLQHQKNQVQSQFNDSQLQALEELNVRTEAAETKNKELEDRLVTEDMTKGVIALTEGKFSDVDKILKLNPALKERLQKIGIHEIAPVDWTRDRGLYEHLPNFELTQVLDDSQLVQGASDSLEIAERLMARKARVSALDSNFFKAKNDKGEWEIHSTEELMHRSNTKKYISDSTYSQVQKRFMKSGAILKDTVLSDEDLELREKQTALNSKTTGIKLDTIEELEAKGLSPSEILTALKGGTPAKTTANKASEAYAVATAKNKAALELEKSKAELKGKGEKPVEYKQIHEAATMADKAISDRTPLDDSSMNELRALELKVKTSTKKEVSVGANVGKDYTSGVKLLGSIDNALVKLKDLNSSNTVSRTWSSLGGLFKGGSDALKSIKVDAAVGEVVAKFVKSISGAAASDLERAFLTKIVKGGDHMSTEVILTLMDEFRQSRLSDAIDTIKPYKDKDLLYSWYKKRQSLNKYDYEAYSPKKKEKEVKESMFNVPTAPESSNVTRPSSSSLSMFNGGSK